MYTISYDIAKILIPVYCSISHWKLKFTTHIQAIR